MTKKIFLEKLEKRLSILNDEERKDIINEYKDIIEEKVKHGMKEEEAVADFGEFNEFVSETLSAYKINPDASSKETKDKARDFLGAGEELIKDGAKKLSNATEKLVSDIKNSDQITIELIFELILKGLCTVVIFAFLTLPFTLFSNIGASIFEFVFFPLGSLLKVIWRIIVSLFYFATCFFLIVTIFKDYVKAPKKKEVKDIKVEKKKTKNTKEEKKEGKNEPKENIKVKNKNESTASTLMLTLLKLFVLFFFIFPMWFCILGSFFFLAFLIYFLIKGVGVLGLILCVIAFILFLIALSNVLYNGIFHHIKVHIYPFLIAISLGVIGLIMTIDFFINFDYLTSAPPLDTKKESYTISITKPLEIEDDYHLIIDNSLQDQTAIIEVSYYDDFYKIHKEEIENTDSKNLYFYTQSVPNLPKKMYHLILENVKKNQIYDYDALSEVTITIKVNENTKNLILSD